MNNTIILFVVEDSLRDISRHFRVFAGNLINMYKNVKLIYLFVSDKKNEKVLEEYEKTFNSQVDDFMKNPIVIESFEKFQIIWNPLELDPKQTKSNADEIIQQIRAQIKKCEAEQQEVKFAILLDLILFIPDDINAIYSEKKCVLSHQLLKSDYNSKIITYSQFTPADITKEWIEIAGDFAPKEPEPFQRTEIFPSNGSLFIAFSKRLNEVIERGLADEH